MDFPGGSDGKASVYNVGDLGSIPGSGRFPGEGNGNPLQYCCLENPMDRGAWCPWGRKESDTTERLHFHFGEGYEQVWFMGRQMRGWADDCTGGRRDVSAGVQVGGLRKR